MCPGGGANATWNGAELNVVEFHQFSQFHFWVPTFPDWLHRQALTLRSQDAPFAWGMQFSRLSHLLSCLPQWWAPNCTQPTHAQWTHTCEQPTASFARRLSVVLNFTFDILATSEHVKEALQTTCAAVGVRQRHCQLVSIYPNSPGTRLLPNASTILSELNASATAALHEFTACDRALISAVEALSNRTRSTKLGTGR